MQHNEIGGVEANAVSFNIVIDCYSKHKDMDKAFDLFLEMRLAGFRRDITTFGALLSGLANVGDVARAVKVIQLMSEVGLQQQSHL